MFKVGDRVRHDEFGLGTVICTIEEDYGTDYGVEFDGEGFKGHNCEGFTLTSGNYGESSRCWWCEESALEVTNA